MEERASYALGVTAGMLVPGTHPLQVLVYYHNGTTGRPFRQAVGSPRMEVKVPAVTAFYSGRALKAMSMHAVPEHSEYDESFRWGMDVGRSSFGDPERLYVFTSRSGQRYNTPRGATSLRTLGRISLETPDMVEQELVEAQAREQAEAEEKARKDEQRKKKKR